MVTNINHGKDRNRADILKPEFVVKAVTAVTSVTTLTAIMTVNKVTIGSAFS
jgi:hypothetical protein